MAFATTAKDETLGELAARLFGVGPRSKIARAAAEELLALNPELKDIKELPEGTLIEVPEIEGGELDTPLPGLAEAAPATLVAGIRASADALENALAATADDARNQANASLKRLRSAATKRAAEEQENKEQLELATAVAEALVVTARAAKAEWRKAAADMSRDLDELLAVLADPR
jgi:5,10-methenyltetrahydromethanopterin hydrogenase